MKIILCTVAAAVGLVLLVVGWTAGGRLMTKADDWSVLQGVLVRALLVGAVLSGGWWTFRKIRALPSPGKPPEKGKDGCCH